MGGVLGSICKPLKMAALFVLSPLEELRMASLMHYVAYQHELHAALTEVTQYHPLFPDLSVQSLENIASDPEDMTVQVESYNSVLIGFNLEPLNFNEGVYLSFAMQSVEPVPVISCMGHGR